MANSSRGFLLHEQRNQPSAGEGLAHGYLALGWSVAPPRPPRPLTVFGHPFLRCRQPTMSSHAYGWTLWPAWEGHRCRRHSLAPCCHWLPLYVSGCGCACVSLQAGLELCVCVRVHILLSSCISRVTPCAYAHCGCVCMCASVGVGVAHKQLFVASVCLTGLRF